WWGVGRPRTAVVGRGQDRKHLVDPVDAVGLGEGQLRVLAPRRVGPELALQELDGAPDGAERVPDLVGEADRHAAGSGERLAPPHLRLELADPRQIAQHGDGAFDAPVAREERRRDEAHGHPPALTAVHEPLRLRAALPGRDRLAEAAHDRGVGGKDLLEVAPLRAARRALGEHLGGGVPEDDPEARVDRDHRVGQAGEDRLVIHTSSMSGRAFMLSGARSPARSRTVPAAVIIAALSVQSRGGGTWSVMPCKVASAASPALSGPFAATPPVRTTRLTPV